MPIMIEVHLPGSGGGSETKNILIRNIGPTTPDEGQDPDGERAYVWMYGPNSGTVRHRRGDGWLPLVSLVIQEIEEEERHGG